MVTDGAEIISASTASISVHLCSLLRDMIRCFIAIDPSSEVVAQISEVRRDLADSGADVRWSREEGLHCTLKFLGAVGEERIAPIGEALRAALGGIPSFSVEARGIGVFPSPQKPRVVWVGLDDAGGGSAVAALAQRVESALVPLGFQPEERPFRAHLTLGRVRSNRGWTRLAERLNQHGAAECGSFRVEAVVLYRSELERGGSVYTSLATIPLAR